MLGRVVARPGGKPGVTTDANAFAPEVEGNGIVHEFAAEDATNARLLALLLGHVDKPALLGDEGKPNLRMRQCHAAHHLGGLDCFRSICLQELEACRRGEEQVLDVDLGAEVERRRAWRRQVAALHRDDMSIASTARPGRDRQATDRTDGGQRLAAKAEEADVDQVIV